MKNQARIQEGPRKDPGKILKGSGKNLGTNYDGSNRIQATFMKDIPKNDLGGIPEGSRQEGSSRF